MPAEHTALAILLQMQVTSPCFILEGCNFNFRVQWSGHMLQAELECKHSQQACILVQGPRHTLAPLPGLLAMMLWEYQKPLPSPEIAGSSSYC